MVCGGGGVGKTTTAAALAIAATHLQKRVLVVTIDPAKRLAEALGFDLSSPELGGAPLVLSPQIAEQVGVAQGSELSVGILNPKYVLEEVLDQSLNQEQKDKLKSTLLYSQLSEMIYGLQEYTAYEWVTRMMKSERYDLIVLDTPPAFHAKDFFNAPEKISNLMESRVFQIFMPKKASWLTSFISFSWLEKLLGERVYRESVMFFEVFALLRGQILERCETLRNFFKDQKVEVVVVSTLDSAAQHELEGLADFLTSKNILLSTIILNQVPSLETKNTPIELEGLSLEQKNQLQGKINQLMEWHTEQARLAQHKIQSIQEQYARQEILVSPMNYARNGFEILKSISEAILGKGSG